jgi:predicted nucleotidyltransferase
MDDILDVALRHMKGNRGGDLVVILMVGSGARRTLTAHSDLDLVGLVKGAYEGGELLRVANRLVDIRYRDIPSVEEELDTSLRLPSLLRKAKVLFDVEDVAGQLLDKANQIFKQGPPPAKMNERIQLKADCFHWLGKAEDLRDHPATAQYLLNQFLEDYILAFLRLRGFWLTAPADTIRFIGSREPAIGDLLERFMTSPSIGDRLAVGNQLANLLFREVPHPPRID